MLRALLVLVALLAVVALAVYVTGGAPSPTEILVAGTTVLAETEVLIERDVVEHREGGDPGQVYLTPGASRYRVVIISSALVPAIEATLDPDASSLRLDVTVEDGRAFRDCLVESSMTASVRSLLVLRKRYTRYGLRCSSPA